MRRWLPILLILLIAAALRLIALEAVPPGLQHDEVFHGHDAVTVLLGYHPLYFTSNAGNEPLFIYLMSATINLLGHNTLGLRLAAVICGLLTVLFTYLWLRRAYNRRIALIASALLAVNFWPLFLSRVGLRAASLPMMAALAAYGLSLIIDQSHVRYRSAILAGVALGLTLYTYPASRVLPIVVVSFLIIYSLLTRRLHKPTLIAIGVSILVAAPLAYTIATLPQADQRLQQLSGPVDDLLKGNPEPVLRYTRDTLGMFTFAGDPIARYNLPGRPVFDPISGLLFYFGLLIAIRHWREPRNLFALIWLPIGLLPSMLSDSAPSFLRASASLPVTFLFPALAIDWGLNHRGTETQRILRVAIAAGVIVIAVFTVRDYFFIWPNRPDVREVYRSDLAQAARWIEQQPSDQPIVVASTNPRDLDPFLFDFELSGQHEVKWIDRAFALVFPAQPAKLISPAYSPIDPTLRDRFLSAPIYVSKFDDGSIAFEVYDLKPASIAPSGAITTALGGDSTALAAPIDLGHSLEFLGYETEAAVQPGGTLKLRLYWRVSQDVGAQQLPLSLFTHLLNDQGQFAAGRDLLAFPTAGWRSGDTWLQQNDLPLPNDLSPGSYRLEIGLYSQADNVRWRVYDRAGNDVGDRLLLSRIEIK
jgi:4-amino-4-deoxy-L-arabinose transferase-like glycosyltransferase